MDAPSEDVNLPMALSINGTQIGALFNSLRENEEGVDVTETQPGDKLKGKSEFLLYNEGKTSNFKFNIPYTAGKVCGDKVACLISNGVLDVYDVSGDKPKRLFSVNDVLEIQNIDETLLIATDENIFAFDTETRTGTVQFSFGDNAYCGLQISGSNYLVCAVDDDGNSSALLINPATTNTDSIDKKVLELKTNVTEIDSISVYGNIIYITPKIGELVYNPAIKGYGADPAVVQEANQLINTGIDEVGIDRGKYVIVNPYQR